MRSRFEEHGVILVRFGNSPKRAIPFKTDKPFKKITANLIAPDGSEGQKVELLADGQQVVGFGIHEDTRKPYGWVGGEPGNITREELPSISGDEAQQLIDDAVELLVVEHGYSRARERKKKRENGDLSSAERVEDWTILTENIRAGHQLHDSLCILAAKLVSSGMSGGAAVNFLRGLMDTSVVKNSDAKRWKARRDGILRAVDSATENALREANDAAPDWSEFGQSKPPTEHGSDDAKSKAAHTEQPGLTPVDLWASFPPPELPSGLLPKAIEKYAREEAKAMGADVAGIAMGALTVCAAAISDRIQLQVKKHSSRNWKEFSKIVGGADRRS